MTKEKKWKKAYEKPRVTRIKLDAKCAVLGFCKNTSFFGPLADNCGAGMAPCSGVGS